MAVTPIIKPITTRKGIFYTFQSSLEDLTLTFSNSGNQFRFSKFVLLNIPNISSPAAGTSSDNTLFFRAQGEALMSNPGLYDIDNENKNLAQSFQNYALNLESLLISQPTYNRHLPLNTSERVFWKWLKESGAIRWRSANSLETSIDISAGLSTSKFTEESEQLGSSYTKVVQYIGEIDIINSYKGNENAFTELYLHVPNNVGSTPYVLFNSISDVNYYPGQIITHKPEKPEDREYISGRSSSYVHPQGLTTLAFYDLDDSTVTVTSKTVSGFGVPPNNQTAETQFWFTGNVQNSYYTDGVTVNGSTVFNKPTNHYITKSKTIGGTTSTISYTRNKLDGVCLDLNIGSYLLASQMGKSNFTSLNDINVQNKNFEFNAALIYYDVIDPVTSAIKATNLYGVLFLNKFQSNGIDFELPRLTKYKPDPLTNTNGNSYAFKLNVKFDTSIEDVAIEPVKNINANAGFGLDIFVDLMNRFQAISAKQDAKFAELITLQQEWTEAKTAILNSQTAADFSNRIAALEKSILANSALFLNSSQVINQISNIQVQLQDFVQGKTSVEVAYNTDVVKSGQGIAVSREIGNEIIISNETPIYNFENSPVFDISTNPIIKLTPFYNYCRHEKGGSIYSMTSNLIIKIDDTVNPWKKGQVLKVSFGDPVQTNGYSIIIKTDAQARAGRRDFSSITEPYNARVAEISTDTYSWPIDNRPIFEIICVNPVTLAFKIDKIR